MEKARETEKAVVEIKPRFTFTRPAAVKPAICPECGGGDVYSFGSTNQRYCMPCKLYYPWELDKDQQSVLEDRKGL